MKKRKENRVLVDMIVFALFIIIMLLVILVLKEEKCRVYTCKYNNELHLSKKCYEKEEDFYCILNNEEVKVDYYYWER